MSIKVSPEVKSIRKGIDAVDKATADLEKDLIAARSEADGTPESMKSYFAERSVILEDIAYNRELRSRLMDKMQAQLAKEEAEAQAAAEEQESN